MTQPDTDLPEPSGSASQAEAAPEAEEPRVPSLETLDLHRETHIRQLDYLLRYAALLPHDSERRATALRDSEELHSHLTRLEYQMVREAYEDDGLQLVTEPPPLEDGGPRSTEVQ